MTARVKLSMPFTSLKEVKTYIGPLVSERHRNRVAELNGY